MKNYDVIIIGAGQAGVPLAKKMAAAGKKTALIEKRLVGGTCINDGCTPTKTMIASAKMAYLAENSGGLGIKIKNFSVNMPKIKKRKDQIVHQFRDGSQKGIEQTKNLHLLFGEAVFTGNKTITIKTNDGRRKKELTAELIFIDTGAQTFIPDVEGLQDVGYLTSTTIMELDEVPEHLLVIGGNYIGLEFGQMFRRFGSKVTVIERSGRLVSREDEDVSDEMTKILEAEKIKIFTNSTVSSFQKKRSGKIIATINAGGVEQKIKCSQVLIAVGRTPQTQNLRLQATGVKTDDRGYIAVNDQLETNVPGIYALGDVKGGPAFTHIAYNDYTIVYRNLIENAKISTKCRPVPYCMFTDPQLGRIGLDETQARKQEINYKVAKIPMTWVARAIETGDTRGFIKAIVNPDTKQILGATVIGEQGGEIMTILQMAMEGGITYDQIRWFIFAHPLYAEALNNLFMAMDS